MGLKFLTKQQKSYRLIAAKARKTSSAAFYATTPFLVDFNNSF
jgi:hypothetical protein